MWRMTSWQVEASELDQTGYSTVRELHLRVAIKIRLGNSGFTLEIGINPFRGSLLSVREVGERYDLLSI